MPLNLPALEALCAATTPGEWCEQDDYGAISVVSGTHPHELIADLRNHDTDRAYAPAVADSRLIAAARNALPELLALARAVEAIGAARRALKSVDLTAMDPLTRETRRIARDSLARSWDEMQRIADTLAAARPEER